MSISLRSVLADAMAHTKIAVGVGFPAATTAFLASSVLLEATGWTWVTSSLAGIVVLLACSLLIGLQLAVEVAAVRVDGLDALDRGSRPA